MFSKPRILHLSIFVTLLTMVIAVAVGQAAMSQKQTSQSSDTSEMLQFTSSGHVLGFKNNSVYVAAGSHLLRESFAGTDGTVPQAEQQTRINGKAHILEEVVYPNLWNGITLIYDRPPGGILRSTYKVEMGADPKQIALQYNVPIHVSTAGNLIFEFDTGTITASAPVAWQEFEGERVAVDVAFRLDSSQSSIHFSLSSYNPTHKLIIDPTLTWNTFLGGETTQDKAYAVAVDDSGNVYVAGDSGAE